MFLERKFYHFFIVVAERLRSALSLLDFPSPEPPLHLRNAGEGGDGDGKSDFSLVSRRISRYCTWRASECTHTKAFAASDGEMHSNGYEEQR